MWDSETESVSGRDYATDALSTSKQGLKTDGFEQRGQNWFVASDIPSDLLVQTGDSNFHLHKYPLISRSGKLNRLIYDSPNGEVSKIILDELPGGGEAFELASKFCYGIAVDLTASNISGLRCAAEFLEMTEDLEEGNLIFKTEAFLSYVVLSSWRDSIVVLKSCERLSPWAENLQIVRRCSESIAWKACANPKGIRWAYTGRPTSRISSPSRWNDQLMVPNSTHSNPNSPSPGRSSTYQVPPDWWFEDVSFLRIDHFVRVITAIKVKGMRFELIGASIMHYASKWLPGLIKEQVMLEETGWKGGGLHMVVVDGHDSTSSRDRRMIIESLVSILPPQKDSLSCSFLLRLLRMANMLKVAPALVTELEKRVGMQFEQASLADLLIPCYHSSGKGESTMYDVDLVQRLLEHFLVQEQSAEQCSSPSTRMQAEKGLQQEGRLSSGTAKARVARLVDSYLTEVARDRNLSLTKFQVLAEALPESARSCDDGLYRAIDSYLKAHPTLSEHERKRLCRVMDCQKLSIDACMHAAQNERLPLRVVVQVLFSEQVKISNALANNTLKAAAESSGGDPHHNRSSSYLQPMMPNRKTLLEGTPQSFQEGWATAKKDINTLKFELESVKTKYIELQNEMEVMQRQFEKMGKPSGGGAAKPSAWTSGWKKLSKLTKMGNLEGHEMAGAQLPHADMATRKTPRRWRNSIS